jgi:hypothetical protein
MGRDAVDIAAALEALAGEDHRQAKIGRRDLIYYDFSVIRQFEKPPQIRNALMRILSAIAPSPKLEFTVEAG